MWYSRPRGSATRSVCNIWKHIYLRCAKPLKTATDCSRLSYDERSHSRPRGEENGARVQIESQYREVARVTFRDMNRNNPRARRLPEESAADEESIIVGPRAYGDKFLRSGNRAARTLRRDSPSPTASGDTNIKSHRPFCQLPPRASSSALVRALARARARHGDFARRDVHFFVSSRRDGTSRELCDLVSLSSLSTTRRRS